MAICVYDNVTTMSRECWQAGRLVYSYDAKLLQPFARQPVPAKHYFFGANIGPWVPGQMVGDPSAIPKKK